MRDTPFLNLVLALVFTLACGWLLILGRPIFLPIATAVIAVYIMISAANALKRMPLLRVLPIAVLRAMILAVFVLTIVVLAVIVTATVREITVLAPTYETNIDRLFEQIALKYGLESDVIWDELYAATIDRIDVRQAVMSILGGFTNISVTVFLVITYAAFLLAERGTFSPKIAYAFGAGERSEGILRAVGEINQRISDYLAIKTLVNVILGVLSFAVLWALGVDFALFWAVSIGLLNYIPYLGSVFGVAFPVALSLAQFGSLPMTLLLAGLLILAQVVMGTIAEPRMIGRQVNLSPVVVLVALSVWTAIWGIPGAILAVPLTSMLAIIFSRFESTRFLAVLLAQRIDDPGLSAR